jgi:preprotein translocase subunit SecG
MEKNRFAIGVLSITATVLLVGVILLSASRPVQGGGMNAQGGDYVMATVQASASTECILVVDAATSQLILYQYNLNSQRLEPLQKQDISLPSDRDASRGPRRP